MSFDVIRKNYDCPLFLKIVRVQIKRDLCDKGEYCPEPQPHIMGEYFDNCSDIFKCGVGKINHGHPYYPGIHLCPANRQLSETGSLD